MIKIIKNVIESGNFELTDILTKIDTFWLRGNITKEESDELYALAQAKAKPEKSIDVIKKLEELEQRIKAIEENRVTDNGATDNEYPDFEIGKWYYANDKVTFDGKKYECIVPAGSVCVWSPKEYPTYWQLITE